MAKRITPEDDFKRLAERLFSRFGNQITDRETFDFFYEKFLEKADPNNKIFDKKFKDKVFDEFVKRKPLPKPPKKPPKKIVPRRVPTIKPKVPPREFPLTGKIIDIETKRRKIVFARKTFVTVREKRQIRFRDKLGRFVSIKSGR